MIANFLRNSWRISRRFCRSEVAVILLVLIVVWYITKWFSVYKFSSTPFEASHSYFTDVNLVVNENSGGKEIGFRHLQVTKGKLAYSNLRERMIAVGQSLGPSWSLRYKHIALSAVQGRRGSMEDRFSILFDSGESVQMFGVYDGHGGTYVAEEAEKFLLNNVMARFLTMQQSNNLPDILKEETLLLDKKIMQIRDKNLNLTGSTALFCVLENNRLHVANVGDSRAVAVKKSDGKVVQITTDHKPINDREAAMVKNAGGSVIWNGVWRVGGILAVSRALGDGFLKLPGWITATPEIVTMDLGGEPLKFMIIASDGLWDVISNEEAAEFVENYLSKDNLFGARHMIEAALKKGSMDNITVMIIVFE